MAVTIRDIAKKVGVSPSTVSRVMNGTATISEETTAKIRQAMEELDYHPNVTARSLANGATKTIGLVLDAENDDAFSNDYFIRSVNAIECTLQKRGYNLLIAKDGAAESVENKTQRQIREKSPVEEIILARKIDGLILPVSSMNDHLVELLKKEDFPYVVMGEPDKIYEDMFFVDTDNTQGGLLTVDYLTSKGFRELFFVVESKDTMFEKRRIEGFEKGLEVSGISKEHRILKIEEEESAFAAKLRSHIGDTDKAAVICTNNVVAYKTLCALKCAGYRIPEDVAVVTFDNAPLAPYMTPPLTAVDVDTYCLGEVAAKTLCERIHGDKVSGRNLISTKIIERESTCRKA